MSVQTPPEMLRARADEAYGQQTRQSMEEQWIVQHLPLVRHVVQKVTAPFAGGVDTEDLISAGTLGLVKAARSFDTGREAAFKTYAYIRIRGAVIDEMRKNSFVPATTFGQYRRVEAAHQKLAAKFGRPPEDDELAGELGISLEQLYRTLQEARKAHFLSIHGLSDDDPAMDSLVPPDAGPSPAVAAEREEMLRRLTEAIKQLSERDRTILILYYDRDLTMRETAEVLGITESRVSQLHASTLFKLAMELKDCHEH